MSEHGSEEIRKHVRVYITVFIALGILTVATVAVSYIPFSVASGVLIALLIASVKASLVACFFMHLISEKKFIYNVLILTACFFAVMMVLIISTDKDQQGSQDPAAVTQKVDDVH